MRRLLSLLVLGLIALAGAAHADGRVYPSPEAVQPLEPGSPVPSVSVQTLTGDAVDLATLVRDAGALVVFYRGGW